MIKGPIVWDLAYHFNQRWAYHEVKDENRIRAMDLKPGNFPYGKDDGDTKAVALRTWEGIDIDGGILAWYSILSEKLRLQFILKTNFRFRMSSLQEFFAKDCKNKRT